MTTLEARPWTLTTDELAAYERDGYYIARGMFSADEAGEIRDWFQRLGDRGEPVAKHWEPDPSAEAADDPLRRYPRVMHPHVFSELSKRYLIDPRIGAALEQLLGEPALAVQTMFYFKPPGGKGQALHQDNFYLKVKPGTCIAAWVAIDPSVPDNGGLFVCPGTHKLDIACPEEADPQVSFTNHLVNPPAGIQPVPAVLAPGDVLFFNGSVIHGSQPNRTKDQWRRSFICHYMPASSTHIGQWYHEPMIGFDGNPVAREANDWGGPCGEAVSSKQ